jgi:hypothetical protein
MGILDIFDQDPNSLMSGLLGGGMPQPSPTPSFGMSGAAPTPPQTGMMGTQSGMPPPQAPYPPAPPGFGMSGQAPTGPTMGQPGSQSGPPPPQGLLSGGQGILNYNDPIVAGLARSRQPGGVLSGTNNPVLGFMGDAGNAALNYATGGLMGPLGQGGPPPVPPPGMGGGPPPQSGPPQPVPGSVPAPPGTPVPAPRPTGAGLPDPQGGQGKSGAYLPQPDMPLRVPPASVAGPYAAPMPISPPAQTGPQPGQPGAPPTPGQGAPVPPPVGRFGYGSSSNYGMGPLPPGSALPNASTNQLSWDRGRSFLSSLGSGLTAAAQNPHAPALAAFAAGAGGALTGTEQNRQHQEQYNMAKQQQQFQQANQIFQNTISAFQAKNMADYRTALGQRATAQSLGMGTGSAGSNNFKNSEFGRAIEIEKNVANMSDHALTQLEQHYKDGAMSEQEYNTQKDNITKFWNNYRQGWYGAAGINSKYQDFFKQSGVPQQAGKDFRTPEEFFSKVKKNDLYIDSDGKLKRSKYNSLDEYNKAKGQSGGVPTAPGGATPLGTQQTEGEPQEAGDQYANAIEEQSAAQ